MIFKILTNIKQNGKGALMGKVKREMTARVSVIFLLLLVGFISYAMLDLELPIRLTLFLTIFIASTACLLFGHSAKEVENYIVDGIKKCGFVTAILLIIGCVIGAWIVSGIIPSIIYYGLEFLTPTTFILGGLVSCSLVSYFTGSSYACLGTLGVALMGIGQGLGVSEPLTAGLVLSGAVFGDKMSPFSDTTNLAAVSADVPLFSHIRSMAYTTAPAWFIAAGLYIYFGTSNVVSAVDISKVEALQLTIKDHFTVSPILLFIPVLTIFLAIRKVPSILAMSSGVLLGIVMAFIFQIDFGAKTILLSLINGLDYDFGSLQANQLFANRGGLSSMLFAVSIAFMALVLGEILLKMGVLPVLMENLGKFVKNVASLVICTILTCVATIMLCASEYLAIAMPGEAFQLLYKKKNVSRMVLSRSLEDGGTIFSSLVPWSANAVFVASTLGVATLSYLPYAFFSLLCPLISILYAIFGFAVWDDKNDPNLDAS